MNVRFREIIARDVRPGHSVLRQSSVFLPVIAEVTTVGIVGPSVHIGFASNAPCNDFYPDGDATILVVDTP